MTKSHNSETITTYLWSSSISELFLELARDISSLQDCHEHAHMLEDLVVGDFSSAIARTMDDKWYPCKPLDGSMLVYGISYTI
jgi:hypothetical protein